MKKYSPLLNSVQLALVCGVAFLPMSEVMAKSEWNATVDSLPEASRAHLQRLKTLLDNKQAEVKAQGKELDARWYSRLKRWEEITSIQPSLEALKRTLKDKGRFKSKFNVANETKELEVGKRALEAKDAQQNLSTEESIDLDCLGIRLGIMKEAAEAGIVEYADKYDLIRHLESAGKTTYIPEWF